MTYSGKYTAERADETLKTGWVYLIDFGRPFIVNPDFPYRLANNLPLNIPIAEKFFGGNEQGYIDYPVLQQES